MVTSSLSVPPYSVWSLLLFCRYSAHPQLFFRRICFICRCIFGFWDEASSGSSYAAILDPGNSDLLLMKLQRDKVFLQSLFLRALKRPKPCCTVSGRYIMGLLLISCIVTSFLLSQIDVSHGSGMAIFSAILFFKALHILAGLPVSLLCS